MYYVIRGFRKLTVNISKMFIWTEKENICLILKVNKKTIPVTRKSQND